MPNIQPLRGLRFDLGHVGALSDVVAPPYDVIDAEQQTDLYKKHPANVIRLILNREEPGDDERGNRYTRAARFLKTWMREGVLMREPDPALYVYHQTFRHFGREVTRKGFMARTRLERFGEGNVYPHEETHDAAKKDRLELLKTCRTNLSPIFGLFPDSDKQVQAHLDSATENIPPLEAMDHLGVVHRMWPVSDLDTINATCSDLTDRPLFIADGHHRYETACDYRHLLNAKSPLVDQHPANYVLTMCVGMSDPGMLVLPTHRLFRGIRPMTSEVLASALEPCFEIDILGHTPSLALTAWQNIEIAEQQGNLGFYTRGDDTWLMARLTRTGEERMSNVAQDYCAAWQSLGVSILHRLVLESLLNLTDLSKPMYVHSVDEVIQALLHGDSVGRDATGQVGAGEHFELASLVMPATLGHIREVSQHQQRMPAKSTYFYPKLLSGLVMNPLD